MRNHRNAGILLAIVWAGVGEYALLGSDLDEKGKRHLHGNVLDGVGISDSLG